MSASNAEGHADRLAQAIQSMSDAGSPFGWIKDDGEWIDYDPATRPDFHDDPTVWHPASVYDYLQDVLDIEYRVTSGREYKSAEVLIAFGGPNAWIDTKTGTLRVAWWSAPVERSLPSDFVDGLNEALSELWES